MSLDNLPNLQPDSGQRISMSYKWGIYEGYKYSNNLLRNGFDPKRLQFKDKIRTMDETRQGFAKSLNSALLGGKSYPVLTTVLNIGVGIVTAGGGALFTLGMGAIELGRRSANVLVREGDEIWHVEEIGKIIKSDRYIPIHVSSILIVDPYRSKGGANHTGWLIDETRQEFVLP